MQRQDKAAIPALLKLAKAAATPLGRAHALWTLNGLDAVDDATLAKSLADASPGIRESAVKLADGRTGLADAILALAEDPEVRVRFQASIALGDLNDPRAPTALARIAARDVEDEWVRLAILSGLRETSWPFLDALLAAHPQWLADASPSQSRLLASTASIIGGAIIPKSCTPWRLDFRPSRVPPQAAGSRCWPDCLRAWPARIDRCASC